MSDKSPVTHDLTQLFEKIKEVRMAMLTTTDEHGSLHSRPMATIEPGKDGALYFLTDGNSAKVFEVKKDSQVNLSYSDPGSNVYASVSGQANAYRDQAKIDELWSEPMRGWFPQGKNDPSITILKVSVDKGEYWDSPSSLLVRAYAYVRAVVTGEPTKDDNVNQHAQVQPK